jgi:hypothetical protein
MHSFILKSTLVLNSALPFWKLLVSEFLVDISETLHYSMSALQAKIVPLLDIHQLQNFVCKDVDVFGAGKVHINNLL